MGIFSGKVVMVTGCARGMGKEAVRLFAEEGASVICCIRAKSDSFSEYVSGLSAANAVSIDTFCFDLGNEEETKAALKDIVKKYAKIDVLVNNAGMYAAGLIQMTAPAKMKEVFQVNFFSQVIITQYISKVMIRNKGGSIVNVGSVVGLDAFPGLTAYGGSKAAMMSFTRTAAAELAPFNVRCNAVAPGLMDTDMGVRMDERARADMVSRTILRRAGTPEEVARLVLFLASDASSYMTGQVVRVDGGM